MPAVPSVFSDSFESFLNKLKNSTAVEVQAAARQEMSQIPVGHWDSLVRDEEVHPNYRGFTRLLYWIFPLAQKEICPADDIACTVLNELVAVVPIEAWEVKSQFTLRYNDNSSRTLNTSSRTYLFGLLMAKKHDVYFSTFARLLERIPAERWLPELPQYIEFANTCDMQPVTFGFADFIVKLMTNQSGSRFWFSVPIQFAADATEPQNIKGSFYILIDSLIKVIRQPEDALVAQGESVSEYVNTPECVRMRRMSTAFLETLYGIVKTSSPSDWSPFFDAKAQKNISPLDSLMDLVIAGKMHAVVIQLVHYVLSIVPKAISDCISPEKLTQLAKHPELLVIQSMLATDVREKVDLYDSLDYLTLSCSTNTALVIPTITPVSYLNRLIPLKSDQIFNREIRVFPGIFRELSGIILEGTQCPADYRGMTLLQAAIAVLDKTFGNQDERLAYVLDSLFLFAPSAEWHKSIGDLPVVAKAGRQSERKNTLCSLVWRFCKRQNGYYFFPVFEMILKTLPLNELLNDIPEYMNVTLKCFMKQGVDLHLWVPHFFYALIYFVNSNQSARAASHSAVTQIDSSIFFRKISFSANEKERSRHRDALAEISKTPIVILIESCKLFLSKLTEFSKKTENQDDDSASGADPVNICYAEVLLLLKRIVSCSRPSDWEPDFLVDGGFDTRGPLNQLIELFFLAQNDSSVRESLDQVLKKTTKEAINGISEVDRKKLLAVDLFSKNVKLLKSCAQKPAPKQAKSAVSSAKPPGKKSVPPAPTPPTQKAPSKPSGKKANTVGFFPAKTVFTDGRGDIYVKAPAGLPRPVLVSAAWDDDFDDTVKP